MPSWSSNRFPIAFGNWERGYTVANRVGTRITLDHVTSVGFVKFFVRTRLGGIVRNREALKVLKVATS